MKWQAHGKRHCLTSVRRNFYVLQMILAVVLTESYNQSNNEIFIGGLFGADSSDIGGYEAFRLAIDYVNNRDDILSNITLSYVRSQSTADGTFDAIKRTCSLVQSQPVAVIGPATTADVKAVSPILDGLHLPHVSPTATDPTLSQYKDEYPYLFKMNAPDYYQSAALIDIISHFGWTKFGILASNSDYGRNGLVALQSEALKRDWVITAVLYFQPVLNSSSDGVRSVLSELRNKGTRVVILNCEAKYARVVFDVAFSLAMLGEGFAWITTDGVTSLDDLYDPCGEVPLHMQGILGTLPASSDGALYEDFKKMWINRTAILSQEVRPTVSSKCGSIPYDSPCDPPENTNYTFCTNDSPSLYVIRVFDAVLAVAYGIHGYLSDGHLLAAPQFDQSSCSAGDVRWWAEGDLLAKYISQVSNDGATYFINFTELRFPGMISYEIVNLRKTGWKQVGRWTFDGKQGQLEIQEPVYFSGLTGNIPSDVTVDLTAVTFRVATLIEAPFTMEKTEIGSPDELPYEGYCIDLLNELQNVLGFQYELYLVPDNSYGGKDPDTGEWNGLVAELLNDRADLVVAPLTINYERDQVVDFTKPFQDLGNIFIMAKESPQHSIFAFLDPFSTTLWIVLGGAFIVCSFVTTLISWISPFGKRGAYSSDPDAKDNKHKQDRNAFNIWNSLWHSFSLWMMQGAEIAPTCLSGRLVYGAWYFTVMVISATYTANLAAFLTVQRLDSGINGLEDLAKQKDITYGTVENTAVSQFFKIQISEPYLTMFAFMEQKSTYVANSSIGIQTVRDSYGKPRSQRYAFIFDSIPLEYAANQPPCEITTIGRLFNQFGYGLALQKNSPYLDVFSLEILKLRQRGFLNTLYAKWVASGSCQSQSEVSSVGGGAQQANITQMMGVFLLLAGILILTMVVIMFEYCAAARNDQHKDTSLSFGAALGRRMRAVRTDIQHNIGTCLCCRSDRENSETKHKAISEDHVMSNDVNHVFDRSNGIHGVP